MTESAFSEREREAASGSTSSILEGDDEVYSYMKFIRPGCHTIVILDPQTKELFKKNIIVQYRLDDPSPFEPDPRLPKHAAGRRKGRDQVRTPQPPLDREIFSVKGAL